MRRIFLFCLAIVLSGPWPAIGAPPTLVLGPGEPHLAHQTDEWCSVERIEQATAIYRQMIVDWAAHPE